MTTAAEPPGRLLVVDDNRVNRLLLQRAIEVLGHETVPAANGLEALERLSEEPFDAVLLDIEMPVLDGYGTLQRIKADDAIAHIPVIMVTGVDEVDSVVRCIELGAVDHLPKPFNAAVLRARIGAALGAKRRRDQELDLFAQISRLVDAAEAVEQGRFEAPMLASVAARADQIGGLARVFQTMAREVVEREQRLRRQIAQLEADTVAANEGTWSTAIERLASYIPFDRADALARGAELDTEPTGAALVADLSGFTAAVATRSRVRGRDRGAEELLQDLNGLYRRLVAVVHRYGGSVVGFAGDGITSWFDDHAGTVDAVAAAVSAGLELRTEVAASEVFTGLKAGVAAGPARRFAVGDPSVQLLDLLVGRPVAEAAALERRARPGELLITPGVVAELDDRVRIAEPRTGVISVAALADAAPGRPWPPLDLSAVSAETLRPWLIPEVFDQVIAGHAGFVAELREASALFLGLDDLGMNEPDAADRLDDVVRWVQQVLQRHHGVLVQLTPTETGGYLYACFGAPRAVADDADAALAAAAELRIPPPGLLRSAPRIGLARGAMRVGGYGGDEHRTYGAIGEQTNLAARLMQVAGAGEVLVDDSILAVTARPGELEPAGERSIKGIDRPVAVHRLSPPDPHALDRLPPSLVTTVKVASIFAEPFDQDLLSAITATEAATENDAVIDLREPLVELCDRGVLTRSGDAFVFADPSLRAHAYARLLYSQRRTLHRTALRHLEQRGRPADIDATEWFRSLATHAAHAEDDDQVTDYLEQAAAAAADAGRTSEALALLETSLRRGRGDGSGSRGRIDE